jgi:transposase
MLVKTLLNHCYRFKRFVYGTCRFEGNGDIIRIIVPIVPRKNSKPQCSGCGLFGTTYDHLQPRLFEFIPIWGIPVLFEYSMRRLSCATCNITVESVPWATGKHQKTLPYMGFLASWAEDLPWKRVGERFHTSWHTVYRAVQWVVDYGLAHRKLDNVTAIGVDEIQYQKGHKYLTLVYQLDQGCRRLLWVGKERTMESFREFFTTMAESIPDFREQLKFVCSDMWKAYLRVIREEVPNALHILDRFHIRAKFSDALDKVRRQEVKRLNKEGKDPVLAKSRWCFLKKRSNLTSPQRAHLKDLLQMNLRTIKAYLLVE